MSLQAKLDSMREQAKSKIPPEAWAIMHRATEDLRTSGIMDSVLKIGERAPDFTLKDQRGDTLSSSELRAKGPLVVSFYRGVW